MERGMVQILGAMMLTVFMISGGILAADQEERLEQRAVYQNLCEDISEEVSGVSAEQSDKRLSLYGELQKANPDFAGWICIEGTVLDYPVCFSPSDPEFYLNHDVYRNENRYGTPFLDAMCGRENAHSNLLLYGHHMRDGSMFAVLDEYKKEGFFKVHPCIQFVNPDGGVQYYEVAAVLCLEKGGETIPWQDLIFPDSRQSFGNAVDQVKEKRLYDTGIVPEYGRQILALVTCEYTLENGRIMVIACSY